MSKKFETKRHWTQKDTPPYVTVHCGFRTVFTFHFSSPNNKFCGLFMKSDVQRFEIIYTIALLAVEMGTSNWIAASWTRIPSRIAFTAWSILGSIAEKTSGCVALSRQKKISEKEREAERINAKTTTRRDVWGRALLIFMALRFKNFGNFSFQLPWW